MNQRHWLNAAEYIAIAASVGGTIATVITQQILLTTTPLTLALVLNVINRQRQLNKVRQLPEHHKLIEIYDDLISVNEDYRFHKLETQGKLDTFEKNQTTLKSLLQEIKAAWKNNQSDIQNSELHQLYFSLSQRIDTITDVVNSESTAYQHQQGERKDKLENFNHPFQTIYTNQKLSELDSVEELKQIVSRYNHESYKYRWSRGLEKEVLDKLNKIRG